MKKTIGHFLFSFLMALSLLAPPVLNLCLSESDAIVILDSSEEEKPDKNEKDKEEKILHLSLFLDSLSSEERNKGLNVFYKEDNSTFSSKIVLPPPEHIS